MFEDSQAVTPPITGEPSVPHTRTKPPRFINDIDGKTLHVGDTVAFGIYETSTLKLGEILAFTEKMVKIKTRNPSWRHEVEVLRYSNQVAKIA